MHDACGVRGRESSADLATNDDGGRERNFARALAEGAQVFAFEKLGDEAGPSLSRSHDVDHFDHVLTGDRRSGLCFPLEALDCSSIPTECLVHHLHRETLRKPDVLGLVDAAHASGCEKPRHAERTGEHFPDKRSSTVASLGQTTNSPG